MEVFSSSSVPVAVGASAAPGRPVVVNTQQPTPQVVASNPQTLVQPSQNSQQQQSYNHHPQQQNNFTAITSTATNRHPVPPHGPPASAANVNVQIAHPQPHLPASTASLNPHTLAAAAANLNAEEFNAQLRQLMASESLAQQWNANLLKFSGLQQQNALAYGPAAAAAAALLNNPAAASYLWPNFAQQCRVALQVKKFLLELSVNIRTFSAESTSRSSSSVFVRERCHCVTIPTPAGDADESFSVVSTAPTESLCVELNGNAEQQHRSLCAVVTSSDGERHFSQF